jgi:ubiquinone/menaquinone biosynthesis C-methylase UbiE
MTAPIDGFKSATLKHLRERWWTADFTEFLAETLRPRPGNRILDVGCGEGLAEVSLGRLQISQIRLVGIDLFAAKVAAALQETKSHNQRVAFAAADACRLPFRDGAFDSLFCVAVLQHIADAAIAVAEFARTTVQNGRIMTVEPDNAARYLFSSVPAGAHAFDLSKQFYAAAADARGERTDDRIGPRLATLFAAHGIETIDVRLFPVSHTTLVPPSTDAWKQRRDAVQRVVDQVTRKDVRELGRELLHSLTAYEAEASSAGSSFVEIQHTQLFAAVGQKA